jgi:predicted deacylase
VVKRAGRARQAIVVMLSALALAAGAQVAVPSGKPFEHDIRRGPGVTAVKMLSAYLPGLANTPGDTAVYVLGGGQPGGTAFVAGGTHANEIAGIMAAVVLVERATVRRGRLIVIPHANNSAITWADPKRPGPEWIALTTPTGERRFKYGSRYTRPGHQGAPDPPKYRHPASTEELEGAEARNLDRAYPGRADGTLTERMAAAIVRLLKDERVDVAFDFHEAGPESRLAWMMVANPKNIEVGAAAVLALEESPGISMKLEPSSETFRGLSHREWGDATSAQAFLFETPSPGMVDNPKGADVVGDVKLPLARRVGVHLAAFSAVLDAYDDGAGAARTLKVANVPSLPEMLRSGVGAFLR